MTGLRDYQADVIARIGAAIEAGRRRLLLVAPTGSGKTVIAAALINEWAQRGQRALFLVHRDELVEQSARKLYDVGGIDAGVIASNGPPMRLQQQVQVAMIPTLYRRALRTNRIDLPEADLVVVDEAHHCRAASWEAIIAKYPSAICLGMSATPIRADGAGLGTVFEELVQCPQIAALIADRCLVAARVYAPVQPNLKGVKSRRGDYVVSALEARMNTDALIGDIVTHWLRLAEHRPTVVFAVGVEHSLHIRNEFRAASVLAEHIDGSTPTDERKAILKRLDAGDIEVVSNCMVLTEGWDQPKVSCIILARPTKSFGLFRQMIGRGLRPYSNKTDLLVLDHSGGVYRHGLPDDHIEWPLTQDKGVINATQAGLLDGEGPRRLTECPECGAARWPGQPCPACGWRPQPKPRYVETADGELGLISNSRQAIAQQWTQAEQQRFLGELRWIAASRGYKAGWASYKFKERLGAWPPRHWQWQATQAPSMSTLSWVRSRNIAWAKSQQGSRR